MKSTWNRFSRRKVRPSAPRPTNCFRGQLELLEDRTVPTATGFRTIDEVGNNAANPDYGAAPADQSGGAAIQLLRLSPEAYQDGISEPSLNYKAASEPSPRVVSNDVFNQSPTLFGSPSTDINTIDGNGLSDFGYSFGQFLDHDMDLTPDQTGQTAPTGDPAANKDGNDGFPIPADKTQQLATITGASWVNGVATITAANVFTVGESVTVAGVAPAGYNGTFTVASATPNSFTFALSTNPGSTTSVTGATAFEFDPIGSLAFSRSVYDPTTGTSTGNPREQTNVVTSYLDLSQVYGSSTAVEMALRTGTGGLLKTSPGNMLPYDNATYFSPTTFDPDPNQIAELNMADSGALPESELYAAGDVRANENTELTALTTLFVRNHNAIATELATQNPANYGFSSWTDENLYQEARKLNIAEYQNIIYTQYLPALLGSDAPQYTGYNSSVNASISTEFSTVGFRFGHSMLNNTIERDGNNGASVGNVPLAVDFFDPNLVTPTGATDPVTGLAGTDIGAYLKGDADSTSQAVDSTAVSAVRDDLFSTDTQGGPVDEGGEDLISRDIWRGRDDGIGDYNSVRVAFGLPAITDDATYGFDQITSNVTVQHELETAYASVIAAGGDAGDIDAFVGGMAEDHVPGSDMGPLFTAILKDQFSRLENGDQFFYLNESFTSAEQSILNQGATLAGIITANTTITKIQSNVFYAPSQVLVNGTELYVLDGGSTSNDNITITPSGSSNTGSTGVQVNAGLNGVYSNTTFTQAFTSIVIVGGSGNDNINVSSSITIPVTISALNGNVNVTAPGGSTVTLGNGNDNITVGSGNSTITVGNGNDNINDSNGTATVTVGSGNDNINLGAGFSTITLGSGNGNDNINDSNGTATIIGGGANGTINVNLGAGFSTITLGNGNDNVNDSNGTATVTLGNGTDNINLGKGASTITAGNGSDNVNDSNGTATVTLGNGNDNINLGAGFSTITLGNGNDNVNDSNGTATVTLGNGTDNINLGSGASTITAGNGNDNVNDSNGTATVTLGNGNDNINVGSGSTITAGSGNDNVNVSSGSSATSVTLGGGNDNVNIGNGNNTVMLGNGNDNVNVGNGNNVVVTGNGSNTINAGNGDNLIAAGTGQHTVHVGNGSNILIDGSVTLANSNDSFTAVLAEWIASGAADDTDIRARLLVTDNTKHANTLTAGTGLNWFFYTDTQDTTSYNAEDLLN